MKAKASALLLTVVGLSNTVDAKSLRASARVVAPAGRCTASRTSSAAARTQIPARGGQQHGGTARTRAARALSAAGIAGATGFAVYSGVKAADIEGPVDAYKSLPWWASGADSAVPLGLMAQDAQAQVESESESESDSRVDETAPVQTGASRTEGRVHQRGQTRTPMVEEPFEPYGTNYRSRRASLDAMMAAAAK